MCVGEVLELRWGDVILDSEREALRAREAKNGLERAVVLGPNATPRTLRGLRGARRAQDHRPADYELLFRSNRGTHTRCASPPQRRQLTMETSNAPGGSNTAWCVRILDSARPNAGLVRLQPKSLCGSLRNRCSFSPVMHTHP
jgi:hypothetical protein